MSEGYLHGILISRLSDHLVAEYGDDLDVILLDVPGARAVDKPPKIDRFFPDVWAQSKRRILLGEAKTALDLETQHTSDQLKCFLSHVNLSPTGSKLVLAVPGFAAPRAKQLISALANAANIESSRWHVLAAEAFTT